MLTVAPFSVYTWGKEGQRHRAEMAVLFHLEQLCILRQAALEQRKDHQMAPKKISEKSNKHISGVEARESFQAEKEFV